MSSFADTIFRHEFLGLLETSQTARIPVFVTLEHKERPDSKILCTFVGVEPDARSFFQFAHRFTWIGSRELTIVSQRPEDYPLRMFNLKRAEFVSSGKLIVEAGGYDLGFARHYEGIKGAIEVIADLTPCQVLQGLDARILQGDGTIVHYVPEDSNDIGLSEQFERTDKEIQITLPLGEATAGIYYRYSQRYHVGNRVIEQIASPEIRLDVVDSPGIALCQLVEGLESEVESICLLLSLCSRQRVDWFAISVRVVVDRKGVLPIPRRRRRVTLPSSDERDPLVAYDGLVDGGLDYLIQQLRKSPLRTAIGRAVGFLVSSREGPLLETNYFLCHAALEGLVKEWVTHSGAEWANLKIVGKVEAATKALNIEIDDLWGMNRLRSGLVQAFDLRNSLFHEALLRDPRELYVNTIRFRILLERLILALLDWPTDKCFPHYTQCLRQVFRAEEVEAEDV